MRPEKVGPHRIERVLGDGGMGVVYRAVAPDGTPVALKVLRAALRTEELGRRFEREARIRIDHPNVARVLDAGVDGEGTPFIALELLEGETLAERLARGLPDAGELVGWGAQACAGLAAAHARGIVHRDLKPSNLFLCADGTLKVLDFGVAATDEGNTRLTRTGAVPGTVGYLSPEQAEGRVAVDARSDVWSLGAVLYEGLTGTPPFQQDTPLATVVATLMADLVPVRSRAPGVPPSLARVVERALARDREERYPSAEHLAEALADADLDDTGADAAVEAGTASIRPGERRVVALLFAEDLDDAAAVERSVRTHGGALLRLVGDRALGLFGGERWEGDEVERAARAALEARDAAGRVSVSSGWATSSGAGIAGAALEAAERCSAAGLRGVALDAEAARTLRDSLPVVRVADGLFELLEDGGPVEAEAIPTVDREAEVAQLAAALRAVLVDRQALGVQLVGPPGIGKSRLRGELERLVAAEAPGATVVSATASARGRDADLALARVVVRAAAFHGHATLPEGVRAGLEQALSHALDDPALARRHAAALSELLTSEACAPTTTGVDLALARDRFRVAFLEWLAALARRAPFVLTIEDLHRADDDSLELLEDLLDEAADAPLLLVATLTGIEPAPFEGREIVRIEPRGLTRADVGTLAESVAGRPLADALIGAMSDRTGGNPFFVVQSVRALADEGRLDASPDALPLPATVEAAVQSRLDHLPEAERDLCRRVSVWGRPFDVAEARGVGVEEPEPLLVSLARRDLVTTRGRRRARVHQLRSPLILDVAYRSLTEDAKRDLHRAAAACLAGTHGADPEETARHHELARQEAEAARAYAAAARVAVRRGDTRSALRCADRALQLGEDRVDRFELCSLRVDALRFLGRREEQGRALEDALEAARDDAQRARVSSERAVWRWRAGRVEEASTCARDAVEAARRSADRDALVLALGRRSLVLGQAGRAREAEDALAEAVTLSQAADRTLRATVLSWRAHHLATTGDLGARLDAFVELAELHEDLGDLRRAAGARANLADAYNRLGAYAEAAEALESALEDCRRVGHRTMEGYTLLNLGYARMGLGDVDRALDALSKAAAVARCTGEARLGALVRLYRARALLAGGGHAQATVEADAVAESSAGTMPDLEVGALTVGARAALAAGDVHGALDRSARALRRYDALGSVEEDEADVFLARAGALAGAGREPEAEAVRARGRARVEEVAASIEDPGLRSRFLRDVPAHAALWEGGPATS